MDAWKPALDECQDDIEAGAKKKISQSHCRNFAPREKNKIAKVMLENKK